MDAAGAGREIVIVGQLQQKKTKWSGTLWRKKTKVYEDERWVVLCLHKSANTIPHLEWYKDTPSIREHIPDQVQDLLGCQYVNVAIGEPRSMIIGFMDMDRPVLEFLASSIQDRERWVTALRNTLRRLHCLETGEGDETAPRPENEYIPLGALAAQGNGPIEDDPFPTLVPPSVPVSPPPSTSATLDRPKARARTLCLTDPILMHGQGHPTPGTGMTLSAGRNPLVRLISSPDTSRTAEQGERCPGTPDQFEPPPLPPRWAPAQAAGSEPQPPRPPTSPIPSSPPPQLYNYNVLDGLGKEEERRGNGRREYDQLAPTTPGGGQQQYQQLAPTESRNRLSGDFLPVPADPGPPTTMAGLRISSSFGQPLAGTSLSSGSVIGAEHQPAQYDVLAALPPQLPPPSPPVLQQRNPAGLLSRQRVVRLSVTLLAEHIALVGVNRMVWVAGWTSEADSSLRNVVHFGDQVEKMAGFPLKSETQLPTIYASTVPGKQVELVLRANPEGKSFTLTKPANPRKELGLVLHRKTNKISEIKSKSLADRAGLPAKLSPYLFHPGGLQSSLSENGLATATGSSSSTSLPPVPAVLTQLDGIPLSLFARNEQFFRRLESVPEGAQLHLTLHPADFCDQIADSLRTQKPNSFRRFTHSKP